MSTGISIAVHKLMALEARKPFYAFMGGNRIPLPYFNIINGGVHAGNKLAFQEFYVEFQAHQNVYRMKLCI